MRELTRATIDIARERVELEREIATARVRLDEARAELPIAERTAKTRRQAQLDAVRGRADLEKRLQNLVESEALARTRRQQAEQRAQGFRAAATFAASGRAESDADATPDPARNERERLVEARANREAGAAEARAAEERVEEQKVGKLRAELEMHVAAEREVELGFATERDAAEGRNIELREIIERTSIEIGAWEFAVERLADEAAHVAERRAAISEAVDDDRRASRAVMEARILELREFEAAALAERTQLEAMIADLVANEVAEREASLALEHAAIAQPGTDDVADVAVAEMAAKAPNPGPEKPKVPLYVARPATAKPANKVKTESFMRPGRSVAPVAKAATDEELIPGLKSLVGTIFTRTKKPAPVAEVVEPPESSSIADRIARDFGLLGGD